MSTAFDIYTTAQCAEYLNLSPRAFADMARDPDYAGIIPKPFGQVGNGRLWDAEVFRNAAPGILLHMAGAQDRATQRRVETMRLQEMQREIAIQEEQARIAWSREQQSMFRQNEAVRAAQAEAEAEATRNRRVHGMDGSVSS